MTDALYILTEKMCNIMDEKQKHIFNKPAFLFPFVMLPGTEAICALLIMTSIHSRMQFYPTLGIALMIYKQQLAMLALAYDDVEMEVRHTMLCNLLVHEIPETFKTGKLTFPVITANITLPDLVGPISLY